MKILNGATRYVLLIGRWAIKVPYFKYGHYEHTGWVAFLHGLLANMQEVQFHKLSPKLCPVIWWIPGGFMLCMRRAEPIPEEPTDEEYENFVECDGIRLPVEHKKCSFGMLDGQLVAVDYGS